MTSKTRAIEQAIIKTLIQDALDFGYTIFYYNGEVGEPPVVVSLQHSASREEATKTIMAEVGVSDEEKVVIYNHKNKRVGSVFFVFGNDGYDVICDHTSSKEMDDLLTGATELANRFAEKDGAA